MDKTRIPTNSKIWPDSTGAISVRRKGQILLVVGILVLSTTFFRPRLALIYTELALTARLGKDFCYVFLLVLYSAKFPII